MSERANVLRWRWGGCVFFKKGPGRGREIDRWMCVYMKTSLFNPKDIPQSPSLKPVSRRAYPRYFSEHTTGQLHDIAGSSEVEYLLIIVDFRGYVRECCGGIKRRFIARMRLAYLKCSKKGGLSTALIDILRSSSPSHGYHPQRWPPSISAPATPSSPPSSMRERQQRQRAGKNMR